MTCKDCNDNGFWTMKDGTNVTCPCDFTTSTTCPACNGFGTLPDMGGDSNYGERVYCKCPAGWEAACAESDL